MSEKYIYMKKFVNGFSFANLGLFYGFGNGVISAVYSLVLMDILHSSAAVGVYSALYSAFCMLVGLAAGEFFKRVNKTKLFYLCMLSSGIMYFMMAFSIKSATFITLDFVSGIPLTLIGMIIPLFLSDFSKGSGMAKLNGRYYLWMNIGVLLSPIIAMRLASGYGDRAAFFAVAGAYVLGVIFFKCFGVVQEDKKLIRLSPKRTTKTIWKNIVSFFKSRGLARAYFVSFGSNALVAMRGLYVPIIVMEQGFSKETLGLLLTIGIIPYIVLSEPLGRLARKYGGRIWMAAGLLSFAGFAFWASFASGWTLLAIFVLWQISGALMEPVRDLPFFSSAKKSDQAKYIGIFKTSGTMPKFAAPILGAAAIMLFGATGVVWAVSGVIALLTTWVLLSAPEKA
jgi:MFS family permease